MEHVMKITIPMMTLMGLLVALMGFQSATATHDAWRLTRPVASFLSAGQTAEALSSASYGLTQERDLMIAALTRPTAISAEMKATLATLREANDADLALGLHQAEAIATLSETRAGQTAIAELDRAVAMLATLRHRADVALGTDGVRRDPGMVKECAALITSSVSAAGQLIAALQRVATPVIAGPAIAGTV
jgi:hypothetical protein